MKVTFFVILIAGFVPLFCHGESTNSKVDIQIRRLGPERIQVFDDEVFNLKPKGEPAWTFMPDGSIRYFDLEENSNPENRRLWKEECSEKNPKYDLLKDCYQRKKKSFLKNSSLGTTKKSKALPK